MIEIYPHRNPIILKDDLYYDYGGDPSTDENPIRRNAAYQIAERRMTRYLGTFLLPTTVTGTYTFSYNTIKRGLYLRYGYVQEVLRVEFVSADEQVYYTISGTNNFYASLRDEKLGILDLGVIFGRCGCFSSLMSPYKINVVYRAGLPTGTSTTPEFLTSLTIVAKIALNEIVGYGNETVGDAAIERFSNQLYSETRRPQARTALGESAQANYAASLVKDLRVNRGVVI